MKGRHQFRRRFSLQPSFMKDDDEERSHPPSFNAALRCQSIPETETVPGAAAPVKAPRTPRSSPRRMVSQRSEEGEALDNKGEANVRHKIVVMGSAKVGKSSLITQFLYGTFSPKYKRTVEEMHHSDFNVSGVHLMLDILDTSGAYEFPAMRALSISSADAFILVYDVTNAETFDEVRTLRDQIHEIKGGTAVPIVIVGNKVDMVGNREVDTSTTETTATLEWENGFVEASAKDNINVSKVFKELLVQAKVKYNLSPALRRRRRQSLPSHPAPPPASHNPSSAVIPSAVQLQHLQQLRDRHGKRNSCIIS
ncbi:ras-related protein Rap-2a-like isoform X1 [Atheta coriaria]|uniref:ras-related protein Rap-2a-like isoform X1 n=1 Tax=Dalotia coriaria TaxID=877792 RepID=UPI0031F3C421